MFKFTALSTVALATILGASPAIAQDAENDGFNGFYIGGSFGGAHTAQKQSSVLFDTNLDGRSGDTVIRLGSDAFSEGFCSGVATSTANGSCAFQRDGLDYYGRIGGDTQRGKIVVGFMVEGGRPDFNESVSAFSTTPARYTLTRDVRYNINARGRIGFTPNDSTLFYAAGGPTYARVRTRYDSSNIGNSNTPSGTQDEWGFNVGGGIEQKIGRNFSIGLEYLYTDVLANGGRVRVGPNSTNTPTPFTTVNAAGTDLTFSNQHMRWHAARVTAAFRF